MPEFDWVTARSKCSLAAVFEKLKLGVEHDVEIRHAILGERLGFHFIADGGSFSVSLSGPALNHVVKFKIVSKEIIVSMDDTPFLHGSVALSDDGLCKIRAAEEGLELEFWQFRKRALDQLFFDFSN